MKRHDLGKKVKRWVVEPRQITIARYAVALDHHAAIGVGIKNPVLPLPRSKPAFAMHRPTTNPVNASSALMAHLDSLTQLRYLASRLVPSLQKIDDSGRTIKNTTPHSSLSYISFEQAVSVSYPRRIMHRCLRLH